MRKFEPKEQYEIEMADADPKTTQGKVVHEKVPVVKIKNLKKSLEERLSVLEKSGQLHPGDIIVGIGGDKGGDTTKMCLVIQNVDTPNNPQGILLLGYYVGADNHHNLEKYMSTVFEQINKLDHVEFDVGGGKKERRTVQKKAIGDCLVMCAMLHHSGPSSSFPCFICNYEFTTHGAGKELVGNSNFHLCHNLRTLDQLFANCRPLFHLNPEDFGPPPIHTIHGVTQKYGIDPMFALANKFDLPGCDIPNSLKEQKEYYKKIKTMEEECSAKCHDLQRGLDAIDLLQPVYEKMNKPSRRKNTSLPSKCSSPVCIVSSCKGKKFFDTKETHQCTKCKGSFHFYCLNVFTSNERLEISNGYKDRICAFCENGSILTPAEQLKNLKELREKLEKDFDLEDLEFCSLSQERSELESQLKQFSGPLRKELELVLRRIGCDHRIWYQEMTGNQIRKLLRPANIQQLVDIFPDCDEIRKIKRILTELAFLMSHADNSDKTDSTIDEIEESINRFVEVIREFHNDSGVTLKLHLLTAHVVPYVRKHRSWGRVSEQGVESMHALMNRLSRRFASVRNQELKCTLILKSLMSMNFLFDVGEVWRK
ncbi:hypothetical protein CAEBREN_06120 [Caenorhabditis brenneri]|uniref:Zinc finger PHD-type domain-containing protein n=1 Tax=Caenorhabditis brenneri TaxID=135651 RepID=G0PF52_CAEBE|nr:hypothetical protein CAEBREN_06120 [Caenorhabditis brenneri]